MTQKHRISANIGQEQKVVVELKQDYDLLEILSLKFTQEDIYRSLCSDYGVVCGRVSVNNGLGVPNAKISIFIPLYSEDEDDPVISALYPYKSTTDRNDENYRYNLLPSRKQHGGHEPTGTFPDQTDILTREEVLEVYEKYYKYTVKTNESGDFMIWGVPIGPQTLHIDVDLSDIGCFSLRPYDLIRQGYGVDNFKNTYEFKSSDDLDSLPQIKSFDKTIEVFPFWGNTDLCEIGITRTDFDLSSVGVKVEPKAFLIGGTYTDVSKNSLNKNCQPRRKMGRKCDLMTKTGKIEAIRFTNEKDENNLPILEFYDLNEDIPEDGSFVLPLPMNMDYIYTNEFGENVITNDPNKGIPTSACYRFRFSLDDTGNARVRKTANYLVPNIREHWKNTILGYVIDDKSYAFSTDLNDYPTDALSTDSEKGILYNINGQYYPRDYFYRMNYNKVYTVSSFHSMYYNDSNFRNDRYVGIKELVPTEEEDCSENVTPPVNYGTRNRTFALIIADVVLLFEHIINLITLIFLNSFIRILFRLGRTTDVWPIRKVGEAIKKVCYLIQEQNQKELYLLSYPECEPCNLDASGKENEFGSDIQTSQTNNTICSVGNITITFNSPGTSTSASPNYLTYTTCTPTPALIPGSTTYDKNLYFIQNKFKYFLIESNTRETIFFNDMIYFSIDPLNNNNLILNDTNLEYLGTYNFIIVENIPVNIQDTTTIEGGCDLYDTPYNENLISYYNIKENGIIKKIRPNQLVEGMDIVSTNLSNDDGIPPNYGTTAQDNGSRIVDTMYFYHDKDDGSDIYQLVDSFEGVAHVKKTTSGQSEFKNGIFIIVPGAQTNKRVFDILKEYRRRKRVAKLFCGGIVNYSFIDNWLSGSLYFFLFKAKKNKYCTDTIRYISSDDKYYYRSTKYLNGQWGFSNWNGSSKPTILLNRPTTIVDLGPRDEFIKEICTDPSLDPNCSVSRSIGSTSFKSFGELLGLAINYRMDVSDGDFSIGGFFNNKGFGLNNQEIFSGDILQLISTNSEAGIEEFDLQSPKYLGYSYQYLDPDNPKGKTVFNKNGVYGPLPVTFYLEDDGERIRACLNEPGRLTESSQIVPFFLWDKKGLGFGPYNDSKDQQSWYYQSIQKQPLQGMTYGYKYTSTTDDVSDRYLLLPMTYDFSGLTLNTADAINDNDFDIVDTTGDNHQNYNSQYPGFTYLYVTSSNETGPLSGILYTRVGPAFGNTTYDGITITNGWYKTNWDYTDDFIIRPTLDYYSDSKQILSTPFLFYFGLKAGKTGLNKFIQYFGDKGVFKTAE